MSESTEFKERHDDYPEEHKEEIYQNFKDTLAEKDPDLARELNAATALPRHNLNLPWGHKNERSQLNAQTIFQAFQESTQGLGKDDRTEASLVITEMMVDHIDKNITEGNKRGTTEWRDKAEQDLPAALDENDKYKYLSAMDQFDSAMRSIEMTYRMEERKREEEAQAEQQASYIHKFAVEHPPYKKSSNGEILEACHQEIARLNPEFGTQLANIEKTPAKEQIENWPLHDLEVTKLIHQVVHQAAHEIKDATVTVIAFNMMKEITESLNRQNEFNVRDRQEFNQIEKQIRDERYVASSTLKKESADDYLESITRMNEIQKRIAGASG